MISTWLRNFNIVLFIKITDFFSITELDMTVKEVTVNDDSGLESTISEEKSLEG